MEKDENLFLIDKTAFAAESFAEANNHVHYWKDKSLRERLEAGFYLSMQMYGVDKDTKLDKSIFDSRKHKNG
jgi:hypothetical protein